MASLNILSLLIIKFALGVRIFWPMLLTIISVIIPSVLEVVNYIVFRKENIKRQKLFSKSIGVGAGIALRAIIGLRKLTY